MHLTLKETKLKDLETSLTCKILAFLTISNYVNHNTYYKIFDVAALMKEKVEKFMKTQPHLLVIKEKKVIKKLNFQVSQNCDRLKNKVSGKGKKGGQGLDERSILCFIECESGETFTIRSCVKGKLVAINQKVVETPNLILEKSPGEAHLAIILTKIPDGITDLKSRLLSEEEYLSKCSNQATIKT